MTNESKIAILREALTELAFEHHRIVTPSKLHDHVKVKDFRNCICLTCQKAAKALNETK